MDISYEFHGIAFVWDQDKGRTNPLKHDGITFEQAAEAFFDPFLKVVDTSRNREARDAIIGMDSRWRVLYVVHMELGEEQVRLISARRATRKERNYYENV